MNFLNIPWGFFMKFIKFFSLFFGIMLTFACSSKTKDLLDGVRKNNSPYLLSFVKNQSFHMNNDQNREFIGKAGTKIKIDANSFATPKGKVVSGKITLKLKEATQAFQVTAMGIPMYFSDKNGNKMLFESAGMIQLNAQCKGKSVRLVNGKTIRVEFPNVKPGDKFKVYFFDGKKWNYHGKNQESEVGTSGKVIGTRIYHVPSLGIYNWDYPQKFSCIRGRVKLKKPIKSKVLRAYTVGVDRYQTDQDYFRLEGFALNVLKNSKVKIMIFSDGGLLGVSKVIEVKENSINASKMNRKNCQDIGMIEVKEKPYEIKDYKDLIKIVGIDEKKYKVKYRKKKINVYSNDKDLDDMADDGKKN